MFKIWKILVKRLGVNIEMVVVIRVEGKHPICSESSDKTLTQTKKPNKQTHKKTGHNQLKKERIDLTHKGSQGRNSW